MTGQIVWLIDTNVISEMMRPRPDPQVATFFDSIEREGIGLASITVWEILDGIGRLSLGRHRESLAARFHDLLDELFEDRIVDWSLAAARVCARIMEDMRRRGEPLDDHVPGRLPRGRRRFTWLCRCHPKHRRVPQHRRHNRRPLDHPSAMSTVLCVNQTTYSTPNPKEIHRTKSLRRSLSDALRRLQDL